MRLNSSGVMPSFFSISGVTLFLSSSRVRSPPRLEASGSAGLGRRGSLRWRVTGSRFDALTELRPPRTIRVEAFLGEAGHFAGRGIAERALVVEQVVEAEQRLRGLPARVERIARFQSFLGLLADLFVLGRTAISAKFSGP